MSSQVEENEEKINVRDRLTDNLLDLSLMNVSKIPVSEIKALRRATILDLSNNRITQIESNFTELTQLTQLDLSKNRINTICDDFGLLVNLRRLDLYNNQITRLPLTFGRLKNLKYLDLQNNPLNPSFKKLIGTCSDTNDCLTAAKRAVDLMKNIEKLVVEGRIKEREQQHTAEQLVEEQLKKEMVTGEGNSTDDSKQDKLKRKRKQDITEILKEPVQKFASANDVDSNRKTNSEGISSLLWILLVIMTAVGACILYSTHSDTLQTICTDIFGEPHGTILDEYIK